MEEIKQVKPEDVIGPLTSRSLIKRHPQNPIFTTKIDFCLSFIQAYNGLQSIAADNYHQSIRVCLFRSREL